jgi:hypothetical protein
LTSNREGSKSDRSKEAALVPRIRRVKKKEQIRFFSNILINENATTRVATPPNPGRRKVERRNASQEKKMLS